MMVTKCSSARSLTVTIRFPFGPSLYVFMHPSSDLLSVASRSPFGPSLYVSILNSSRCELQIWRMCNVG